MSDIISSTLENDKKTVANNQGVSQLDLVERSSLVELGSYER